MERRDQHVNRRCTNFTAVNRWGLKLILNKISYFVIVIVLLLLFYLMTSRVHPLLNCCRCHVKTVMTFSFEGPQPDSLLFPFVFFFSCSFVIVDFVSFRFVCLIDARVKKSTLASCRVLTHLRRGGLPNESEAEKKKKEKWKKKRQLEGRPLQPRALFPLLLCGKNLQWKGRRPYLKKVSSPLSVQTGRPCSDEGPADLKETD